ncbi:hypothetical protein D3C78_1472210 [compost metagenome]
MRDVKELQFARAFFAIWLDPRTRNQWGGQWVDSAVLGVTPRASSRASPLPQLSRRARSTVGAGLLAKNDDAVHLKKRRQKRTRCDLHRTGCLSRQRRIFVGPRAVC